MTKEKTTQQHMQLQVFVKQINQMQSQLKMIEAQTAELETIKQGIDDLQNIKPGSEILSPLSNGIFVKSKIEDNKNFIVNVGDSIIVKKTSKQAKEFMDKQIGELKRFQTRLLTEIQSLTLQANYLEKELMESIK